MALNLSGSNGISGVDGSASTPALQGSDSNTGIHFPAADTVAIDTGGSERIRCDSSGRLLVGTSNSRAATYADPAAVQIEGLNYNAAGQSIILNSNDGNSPSLNFGKSRGTSLNSNTVVQVDDRLGVIDFAGADGTALRPSARIEARVDGTPGANDMPGRLVFSTCSDGSASPTERMRITQDGRMLFGCTAVPSSTVQGFSLSPSIVSVDHHRSSHGSGTGNMTHIGFYNGNGIVGSITTNGSATAYGTSSDYRLKENVEPLTGSVARLQQLKPSRFNFISDPTVEVDGFIAHEVQGVVPEAVSGEKDAVNDDGTIKPQSIDQSKLVPLLTAALQEALVEIKSLKARVTALEP